MTAALPAALAMLLDATADRHGVARSLVRAVAWVESRGNHFVPGSSPPIVTQSARGALGLMQLMPETAAALAVDPNVEAQNAYGGAKLLRRLLDRFGANEPRALAAYVWGAGNVNSHPEPSGWPESVLDYVAKVRARADQELRDMEDAPTAVRPSPALDLPTTGARSFGFARSTHTHNGIDLRAPHGTPVYAAAPGWVEHANTTWLQGFSGYGRNVVIASLDGARELYAHLDSVLVNPGQRVEQGEQVGTAGRTEFSRDDRESLLPLGHDHVHFEVAEAAYPMKREARRLDPVTWLEGRMHPIARVLVGGRAAAAPFPGSLSSALGQPPHCPSCSCAPLAAGGEVA